MAQTGYQLRKRKMNEQNREIFLQLPLSISVPFLKQERQSPAWCQSNSVLALEDPFSSVSL
jgi:hypothetical protein